MGSWSHFYLLNIEFLGFRYSGWQKQPGQKTVHGMVDKTLEFVLGEQVFKTLGCGRTDAKVSARDFYFELFTEASLDLQQLMTEVNRNLPPDIRVKLVQAIDSDFNIIQDVQCKEYHYYFSHGHKASPWQAPFQWCSLETLDLESLQEAAKQFRGEHWFGHYAVQAQEHTVLERNILNAEIIPTQKHSLGLPLEDGWVFKVRAKGFLRNQVRLMMGALIEVGLGQKRVEDIALSLEPNQRPKQKRIAPASGLVLHKVDYGK